MPAADVQAYGMESITNLCGGTWAGRPTAQAGKTIAPERPRRRGAPGEGWTHDPYGAEIVNGAMYGRATAVSKGDLHLHLRGARAEAVARPPKARWAAELHFTYDEEFGGKLGPGWLLKRALTKPDLMICRRLQLRGGHRHNGCLQMEVTVHGKMAHAAVPPPAWTRCRARCTS